MEEMLKEEYMTPDMIEDYLAYLAQKGRGKSSLESYRGILLKLCDFCRGGEKSHRSRYRDCMESTS